MINIVIRLSVTFNVSLNDMNIIRKPSLINMIQLYQIIIIIMYQISLAVPRYC